MQKNKISLLIVILVSLISSSSYAQPGLNKNKDGFALIELFASEGCSSCPAAEALLSQVAAEYPLNVYVMEYHVDYWNNLGWKDIFSSSDFTERQKTYSGIIKNSSVYTPQAIVNGTNEFVGSDRGKMKTAISKALSSRFAIDLKIKAVKMNNEVAVSYMINDFRKGLLNIALIQKHAETNVIRGENKGRKLSHINVVRVLNKVDLMSADGRINIKIPDGLEADNCSIIAFVQDKDTFEVKAVAESGIY